MLIDDDPGTNFIHKYILERFNFCSTILIYTSASEALEYVKKGKDLPEVIFLDINMPGMDGWEFIEEYDKLDEAFRQKSKVFMLSTSLNPRDPEMAGTYSTIRKYYIKPLSAEILDEINRVHFQS